MTTERSRRVDALSPARRALLEKLLSQERAPSERSGIGVWTGADGDPRPMSSAQLRLWFLHQLEPEGHLYNTFLGVELTGPLDVAALDRTLAAIEARHEVLRASFPAHEGRPLQRVGSPRPSVLTVADLRALDPRRAERLGWSLARREVRQPFDLDRGPVWRARLVRLEQERCFLVLTLHHVVSDRWSIDVLLFELAHHYEAHLRAAAPLLPALPVQYADFAAWQNERLESGLLERQLDYWTERLRERPEPLDLAPDRRPGPVRTSRGGRATLSLPESLIEGLAATSQRQGATLFMTMLTAFKALLMRRSGCEDLVVGTPIANRTRAEIRALIGCFVNTLVLRTDLSGAPTFEEAVGRVRQVCVEAYAHQDLPLERLVEALQPDREGGQGLFQVIFALNDQHNPLAGGEQLSGALARQGLSIRPLELDSGAVQADLVVHVERRIGGTKLLLDCSLDLFDGATAVRLAREYRTLLEGAAADPDRPLRDLPLLGPAERHQLVAEWNDSATLYPGDATLRDLWLQQVARTPDAVALDFDGQLSYGELHRRACRLARRLAAQGVGPGSCVAVHLERSRDLVVALLGVIEAGAAYLPLDTLYPPERIDLMVEDAGARLAVTETTLAGNLPASCRVLKVEDDAGAPAPAGDPTPGPLDLAYVIHTSGSTGRPKGVAVPHQAVIRLVCRTNYVRLTPGDRIAQVSNVSFDAATFEIWGALLHGARLVGLAKETVLEVEELRAALARHGISVMFLTTSLFHELAADDPRAFASLSTLIVGGEALDPGVARRVLAAVPPRRLLNAYGPTETTTFATTSSVAEVPPGATGVPIGRSLANTTIHVLDRRLAPVPIGVAGELLIGGDGTARGYLGRSALTAASFVPDPFDERGGSRLYRTGDLARRRADGQVEFLGRGDQQVKIRGFRIEPGEIEAVLGDHPAVRQVAVLVLPDSAGAKRLVAYVAAEGPERPGSRELREHLESRVPEYMVPAAWVLLDALPLNANGKLDRAALPAPETVAPDLSEGELDAPEDPVEELVAAVWADLLGVQRVGRRDQFFELGGHSLVATRVVARLEEALGVRLPLRTLFERPTVADTADALREFLGRPQPPASGALPPLVPVPGDAHLPFGLTEIQEAYWIGRTDAFELGNVSAHGYLELDFDGLDLERLDAVANRLIGRHPMLRAVIDAEGRQRILTGVAHYRIATEDLREVAEAEREAALASTRERLSHQVLPADRFPLFELSATLLPEGRVRLHVGTDALISDAWSWQILAREAAVLYDRPEAELPGLEVTFRDYMTALEALRGTDLYERSLAYWRARLADFPGAPELPVRAGSRQISSPRFLRRGGRLEAGAWRRLKSAGLARGLTPSGLVLAAFAAVLAAWSKTPRFALNLTLFNRFPFHPDVYRIVGDFTSLTLLEVDARSGGTFCGLARRVQARLWDDLDHRFVSGVRVLRELAAGQGGARVAMPVVFTSLLSLEAPTLDRDAGGLRGRLAHSVSQTPQVWLDHQVHEEQGSLVYTWDAVDDVFLPGVLDAMFGAFVGLLDALSAEGSPAWEAQIPCLVPEAQLSLRRRVNATAAPVPGGSLHHLGLEHLRRHPEAPAVIDAHGTISYRHLFRRAGGIARRLGEVGVAPGELVAIAMSKGREQVTAVLGALQAGAAYLPVDPGLPAERVRYLLADGGVGTALTQSAVEASVPWPDGVERLAVDRLPPRELVPSVLEGGGGSRDLAYVIYTSGSTGRPKGVMIDHRGAVNTVADVNARFSLSREDRVFGISSLSFDLSVWDLFGSLAAGAALVLPDPDRLREPGHWAEVLRRHQVTVWSSVPALMTLLVEHLRDRGERLPASLRLVMLSGDWIPVSLPDRIRDLADREVEVVSLGGATEASIWSILYPVGRVDPGWASIPYGRPMVNQTVHVLDDGFEPRPVWVPGELYIGGVGVALGYWNDPERTAAKFLTHPATGERLYRTGDLGRHLPDGDIEFLGRDDFQVKIQGYRIELGEIESALSDHPGVREAVVTVHEGASGRALVGYVVAAESPPPGAEELRAYLLDRLPQYMVPLVYTVLEALPLSANGKVDRGALPAPGPARGSEAGGDRGPRSAAEEIVAGMFAEVLETPEVGPSDDFFTLGGNSMVATRLVSQLREVFDVEVPLRVVFEATTVEELAARLDELRGEEAGLRLPPLEPTPRPAKVPLSFAQQRLWLVDRLSPGTAAYSMPAGVRLRGRLDAPALARSLEAIIERHEALRTTFFEEGGEPVQVIHPAMLLRLPVVDLESLEPGRRETAAFALCRAEARRPFSLEQGPLVRARLFRLAHQDHLLLLAMHHIVSDGWSLGVLVDEIARLYPARVAGRQADLPALPVQYGDFALWQRGWLRGEVLESQLRYWRERLQGAPGLIQLPTDRPRPAVQRFRGAHLDRVLDPPLAERLRQVTQERRVTLFMSLLVTFQVLLARLSGQGDVVVGSPIANRTRRELEGLIGFFANTLVLRTDLSDSPPFVELLRRGREVALGAQSHQDLPFERLVEELQPARALSYMPLFQVMFVLQNAPMAPLDLEGLVLEPVQPETGGSHFDLTLRAWEEGDAVRLRFEYDVDLFDATTVARMARHFETVLESALARPRAPVLELPILSPAEHHQVVSEWNGGSAGRPEETALAAVLRRAGERPGATAVVCGDRRLTYGELAERSGRLAGRLARLGVGPGSPVAVLLDRSPETVVTILAVLRAGGFWVPLDPSYPKDRVAFALDGSGARVAVTRPDLGPLLESSADPPRWIDPSEALEPDAGDGVFEDVEAEPGRTAYLIYTSGSTGRPKGVQLSVGGLAHYVGALGTTLGITGDDVYLHTASFGFSSSVRQLILPLARGATLVVAREDEIADPARLLGLVRREGVTVLDLVPSYWRNLVHALEALPAARRARLLDNRIRLVVSASEPLPIAIPRAWRELLGPAGRVVNMFGQTETTGIVAVHPWNGSEGRGALVPIGRPIPGMQVHLLDPAARAVPLGVAGEIYAGGPGLGLGYLGQPALTALVFVPDPFSGSPGGRLYRTGDLGRRRPDGGVEFVGRRDQQVKVRGFRVEPGEVEAVLSGHDGVAAAIVLSVEDAAGFQGLAAFVVPAAGPAPEATELRDLLRSRLPEYMVPASFLVIPEAPVDPHGQGGSPGAAEARAGRRADRGRGPAHSGGGGDRDDLRRGPGAGDGGEGPELLRPGRPLSDRHPGHVPCLPGLRGFAAAAPGVRGAHGGGPGLPGRGGAPGAAGRAGSSRAGRPRGRPPPELRPAASVADSPARAVERRLQHPGGAGADRRAGRRGSGGCLSRGRLAPRDSPDPVRHGGRRAGPGGGGAAPGAGAPGGPLPARPDGAAAGGEPRRLDRGAAALRSRPDAPLPLPAPTARSDPPPAPPDGAPHRFRRLVGGDLGARGRRGVPGREPRRGPAPARPAGPVRRLRRLAAPLPARRGPGPAARLLARAPERRRPRAAG